MHDDDLVFKALADPTRRFLLDQLFTRDGRTLTELESELEMTRFGVMKHLRVLEDAGLVVTRKVGTGEAALPQSRADPAHPRSMDRQVHGAPRLRAHGSQTSTRGGLGMTSTATLDTSSTCEQHDAGLSHLHQGHAAGDLGRDHEAGVDAALRLRAARRVRAAAGREVSRPCQSGDDRDGHGRA